MKFQYYHTCLVVVVVVVFILGQRHYIINQIKMNKSKTIYMNKKHFFNLLTDFGYLQDNLGIVMTCKIMALYELHFYFEQMKRKTDECLHQG